MASNEVCVFNFPPNTTQDELADYFSQAGQVTAARIMTDRETGLSKGYAFIMYATDAGAAAAVRELHGVEFDGQRLRVSPAVRRGDPQRAVDMPQGNLYVGGLAPHVTGDDLLALVSEYGRCDRAVVLKDFETGLSRGFGFARMETDAGLAAAIAGLDGKWQWGGWLTARPARQRQQVENGN